MKMHYQWINKLVYLIQTVIQLLNVFMILLKVYQIKDVNNLQMIEHLVQVVYKLILVYVWKYLNNVILMLILWVAKIQLLHKINYVLL
jgi:hypothetical protein